MASVPEKRATARSGGAETLPFNEMKTALTELNSETTTQFAPLSLFFSEK